MPDSWAVAESYEQYVGRWSRLVAREFVRWLDAARGHAWLDVGCGTGALSEAILARAPSLVLSLDRSLGYAAAARALLGPDGARCVVADGCELPLPPARFDRAVSALVLNFVTEPGRMISEMRDVVRPGGCVAVYVWDYAERMELMRLFWDAALELDPAARALDEAVRFPLCRPEPLRQLFERCRLAEVQVRPIDVPTVFRDFDSLWQPFLGGQGPAPGYVASLDPDARIHLRDALRARLRPGPDGAIRLVARAWAARGTVH